MSTTPNPLIASLLARQNSAPIDTVNAPALTSMIAAPSNLSPSLGSSIAPAQTTVNPFPNQLQTDQSNRNRLINSGDGVSQISNPLLRGIARAADIAGTVFAPNLARAIPGTMLHHNMLVNQATQNVAQDQAQQQAVANTAQTEAKTAGDNATTAYETQKPILEQNKIDATKLTNHAKFGQLAAKAGQTMQIDPVTGEATFADDPNSQAYKDRIALAGMHQATAEKDAIMGEIAQNKYQPGTQEYNDAQRRLDQVDKRLRVSMAGLGLRAQGLQLRQQNTNASLYGTDMDGNPLPGAAQISDNAGNLTTVGSKNAGHAISQQKSVGSFNDLSGSVTNARQAIQDLDKEGGSLSDPEIVAAMSDPTSIIGKVVNGKLVKGNLSDTQIKAVNAVRQLHEQAGILRSTTGGTSSEAGAQRILDVVPGAGDATKEALNKLDEQEKVLGRLSVGQTHVSGGLNVAKPAGTNGGAAKPDLVYVLGKGLVKQ